jgi:probable addiction module antidote protein
LETPEEMAAYLEICIEEADGNAAFIARALEDIARVKGTAQIDLETGLLRERLYKAFSGERRTSFDTVLKVISALGPKLSASAKRWRRLHECCLRS